MSGTPLLEKPVRNSVIVVDVLDLSSIFTEALKRVKDTQPGITAINATHKWGIVATNRGIFALCDEGVGPNQPVTAEKPLVIDLYADYVIDGQRRIGLQPLLRANLTDKDLADLPVKERVNLADFIRRFGHRLEDNFEIWNAALTGASR